jgi:hypothetical protein
VYGRFYSYEGTIPAMDSLKRYAREYGLPQSVYLDKHSTYKGWALPTIEEELTGEMRLTEFGRACEELGVKLIHAHSPQAKGRVERLFRTLQDRLVKEMRLAGCRTLEEANVCLERYLPIFNAKFMVEPTASADLHQKPGRSVNWDRILCIKTRHALRNDLTVVHEKRLYQVLQSRRARQVIVEERLDGTLKLYDGKDSLSFKEILNRPAERKVLKKSDFPFTRRRKKYIPPLDHPWRGSWRRRLQKTKQTRGAAAA